MKIKTTFAATASILLGLSTVSAQVISVSPSGPLYRSTGETVSLAVTYLAGNVANRDQGNFQFSVAANPNLGTESVSGVYASCLLSNDFAGSRSVTWADIATGQWPNGASCGGQTANFVVANYNGTVTGFTSGITTIALTGATAGTTTNVNVNVCQKTTVTSVTTADVTEGAAATFTVNFAAVAAGCGGFAIPATLTTVNKGATISANTCGNVADGATSCTFTVTTVNNALADGSLPVTLTVTNSTAASNYVSTGRAATAQILDDEVSASVAATTAAASENGTNGVVTFSRGGSTAASLQLTSAISGTATYTTDYTLTAGTCTINSQSASSIVVTVPAAAASCTINVVPVDDALTESAETVIFAPPTGPSVATTGTSATVTIADNDGPQTITVAVTGSSASEEGGTLTYTFTRSGNAGQIAAALSGVSITAPAAGPRFNTTCTSTISFAAASTTATCTYTGIGNSALDGNVNVVVTINPGAGYTVGSPASATGVIADNEVGVSVVPTASSITEGGIASFTLSCTGSGTFAIPFTINTLPSDGAPSSASPVNVTCGAPTVITVQTAQNTTPADSRSLTLTLGTPPAGAAVTPGQGAATVAVADDDGPPPTIPTMGAFGLALLGLLMAGFGAAVQRRRK